MLRYPALMSARAVQRVPSRVGGSKGLAARIAGARRQMIARTGRQTLMENLGEPKVKRPP